MTVWDDIRAGYPTLYDLQMKVTGLSLSGAPQVRYLNAVADTTTAYMQSQTDLQGGHVMSPGDDASNLWKAPRGVGQSSAVFSIGEFGTVMPGGYGSASFTVPDDEVWAHPFVYCQLADVRIVIADGPYIGKTVWTGYLKDPVRGTTGEAELNCDGWWNRLKETEKQWLWSTKSVDDWVDTEAPPFKGFTNSRDVDMEVRRTGFRYKATKGSDITGGDRAVATTEVARLGCYVGNENYITRVAYNRMGAASPAWLVVDIEKMNTDFHTTDPEGWIDQSADPAYADFTTAIADTSVQATYDENVDGDAGEAGFERAEVLQGGNARSAYITFRATQNVTGLNNSWVWRLKGAEANGDTYRNPVVDVFHKQWTVRSADQMVLDMSAKLGIIGTAYGPHQSDNMDSTGMGYGYQYLNEAESDNPRHGGSGAVGNPKIYDRVERNPNGEWTTSGHGFYPQDGTGGKSDWYYEAHNGETHNPESGPIVTPSVATFVSGKGGGYATFTVPSTTGLLVGRYLSASGWTPTEWNGDWQVSHVTSSTQFTAVPVPVRYPGVATVIGTLNLETYVWVSHTANGGMITQIPSAATTPMAGVSTMTVGSTFGLSLTRQSRKITLTGWQPTTWDGKWQVTEILSGTQFRAKPIPARSITVAATTRGTVAWMSNAPKGAASYSPDYPYSRLGRVARRQQDGNFTFDVLPMWYNEGDTWGLLEHLAEEYGKWKIALWDLNTEGFEFSSWDDYWAPWTKTWDVYGYGAQAMCTVALRPTEDAYTSVTVRYHTAHSKRYLTVTRPVIPNPYQYFSDVGLTDLKQRAYKFVLSEKQTTSELATRVSNAIARDLAGVRLAGDIGPLTYVFADDGTKYPAMLVRAGDKVRVCDLPVGRLAADLSSTAITLTGATANFYSTYARFVVSSTTGLTAGMACKVTGPAEGPTSWADEWEISAVVDGMQFDATSAHGHSPPAAGSTLTLTFNSALIIEAGGAGTAAAYGSLDRRFQIDSEIVEIRPAQAPRYDPYVLPRKPPSVGYPTVYNFLARGTYGTSAASHTAGTQVYQQQTLRIMETRVSMEDGVTFHCSDRPLDLQSLKTYLLKQHLKEAPHLQQK